MSMTPNTPFLIANGFHWRVENLDVPTLIDGEFLDGQNWEVIWGGEHFPTPEAGQLGLGLPHASEAYRRLRRLKFGIYALVDSLVSSDAEDWDGEYTSEGLVLCSYKGDGRKEEFLTASVTLG